MFGAYVADTYLGRYNTICWAILIALIGHILLIIAAIPSVISNPNASIGVFALAIIIMGVSSGVLPLRDELRRLTLSSTDWHGRFQV